MASWASTADVPKSRFKRCSQNPKAQPVPASRRWSKVLRPVRSIKMSYSAIERALTVHAWRTRRRLELFSDGFRHRLCPRSARLRAAGEGGSIWPPCARAQSANPAKLPSEDRMWEKSSARRGSPKNAPSVGRQLHRRRVPSQEVVQRLRLSSSLSWPLLRLTPRSGRRCSITHSSWRCRNPLAESPR